MQLGLRPSRPCTSHSQRTYRRRTPTQHALFLRHVTATVDAVDNPNHSIDIQTEFDIFYSKIINLLNHLVTVNSRDTDFITPLRPSCDVKIGSCSCVEEAEAIAKRITQDITKRNKVRLSHINPSGGTKDIWKAVRELTGRERLPCIVARVSAESLKKPLCQYIHRHSIPDL